ncbi:MAG: response regulator [Alteromonadaceae bacterium]|nr:response regulator [Alteromonadaceae bacterium]
MTSVVLVDDHQMVRDGFHQLIDIEPGFDVVGSYGSVEEAIASGYLDKAEILITDISMQGDDTGFTLVEYVNTHNSYCKTILVSMYENTHYVNQARNLGVKGFVSKREASDTLIFALHQINQGGVYFSNDIKQLMPQAEATLQQFNELTTREQEVFLALAKGYEVKHISSILDIAVKTVHTHRRNIMNKFQYNSTFQITKFALKHGIIQHTELC